MSCQIQQSDFSHGNLVTVKCWTEISESNVEFACFLLLMKLVLNYWQGRYIEKPKGVYILLISYIYLLFRYLQYWRHFSDRIDFVFLSSQNYKEWIKRRCEWFRPQLKSRGSYWHSIYLYQIPNMCYKELNADFYSVHQMEGRCWPAAMQCKITYTANGKVIPGTLLGKEHPLVAHAIMAKVLFAPERLSVTGKSFPMV